MTLTKAVDPWTLEPLRRFVAEAGARLALLTTPAGQVVAQHGFTRAVDVMAAAALGAAIAASTAEINRMLAEPKFRALTHQGVRHGIYLASFATPRGPMLALVVYGSDSSIGLVQLFFEDLVRDLAAAAPPPDPRARAVLAQDFERDLNDSLAALFGR
ncbi:MAG TPA: roadblock/LC7 domain-containing protein [Gemmatimonadales bacterium]|nr:roadblock/LC7 domain-containing protein [Gemmatimonadales bacterium]